MPLDSVTIGDPGADHVTITASGRMHPGADDYWDGNWLISPISVAAGSFAGTVRARLRAEELVRFRTELEALYDTLTGEAHLNSLEGWIDLTAHGDGQGGIEVCCNLNDQPGLGNELSLSLTVDQTYLPEIVSALLTIESSFPILGQKD